MSNIGKNISVVIPSALSDKEKNMLVSYHMLCLIQVKDILVNFPASCLKKTQCGSQSKPSENSPSAPPNSLPNTVLCMF